MNKAWSDLPNAHHIDWMLKSVRENIKLWNKSWSETKLEGWVTAWDTASYVAWNHARWPHWVAAMSATKNVSTSAAFAAARNASASAIAALIVYDDCDQFLNMSYEKLKVWVALSEDPCAILLVPMVYVKKQLLQEVVV